MARQFERRASSGCVDERDFAGAVEVRPRLWRRVSWMPGAEGAPTDGTVAVGAEECGVMRRAWD